MKQLIYIIIAFSPCSILVGQQDVILTKYTFSSLFFNPAYAGSAGDQEGSILLNYRDQWIGLEGSPNTILLGGDMNLADDRVGIGASIARESIGIETNQDVLLNAAYRIYVGEGVISGGLRMGFHNYKADFLNIKYGDLTDPIYDQGNQTYSGISLGSGIYYNSDDFYAGFSVPAIATLSSNKDALKSRHYYLHGGALLGGEYSDFRFEPSILLKYEKAAPLQYTLGTNLWLIENFAVGIHYRSTDAVALSAEFIIADQLSIGAAYDFTTNDLKQNSSGTMELLMAYRFSYKSGAVPMGRSRRFR